jgi:hypothetical protein
LQTLIAERQDNMSRQMNILTAVLVFIALLEAVFHAIDIWMK